MGKRHQRTVRTIDRVKMCLRQIVFTLVLLDVRCGTVLDVESTCDVNKGSRSANCSFRGLYGVPDLPGWVESLDMTGNPLGIIKNNAFQKLKDLSGLIVAKCTLKKLESNAFSGIEQLKRLDLSENPLNESMYSIPKDVFKNLQALERLNLDGCNFVNHLPDLALSQLVSLKELVIKGPHNLNFGSEFRKLTRLQSLLVRNGVNKLYNDTFTNVPFLRNLWLDMLVVKSIEVGVFVPLRSLKALTIQRCKRISLEDVLDSMYGLRDRNISSIWLEKIYIQKQISLESMGYLGDICLKNLTLRENFIGSINTSVFLFQHPTCLRVLKVDVTRYAYAILHDLPIFLFRFVYLTNLEFTKSQYDDGDGVKITSDISETVGFSTFIILPGRLQVLRACCWTIKDSIDKVTTVLNGQSLKELDMSYTTVSECTGRIKGLTSLETVKISGFNCSKLNPRLLHDMPTLQTFVAASAQLGYGFSNDTEGVFFKGLYQLSIVDISNNYLHSLHADLFLDQEQSLRVLDMSKNALQAVPQTVLLLTKLKRLDLRQNQLTTVTKESRLKFDGLSALSNKTFQLLLSGNSFKCGCDSLDFIHWIFTTSVLLDNSGNYGCTNDDGTPSTTFSVYKNLEAKRKTCGSSAWFVSASLFSLGVVGILVVSSLLYHYRFSIQYWCLQRRRHGYTEIPGDDGVQNDAFVAYDHRDSGWVCHTMREKLETDNQLQLCLHERDFAIGNYITDNILDAIEKSRRIVMVVSRNFLTSRWCEFEMEMTRVHVFTGGRDRRKAVIVLLEDIPRADMPPALQTLWGRVTCLKYPNCENTVPDEENVFWNKLCQAIRE